MTGRRFRGRGTRPVAESSAFMSRKILSGRAGWRLAERRACHLVGSDQLERSTPPKYFTRVSSFGRTVPSARYRKSLCRSRVRATEARPLLCRALVEAVLISPRDERRLVAVAGHRISTRSATSSSTRLVRRFVAGGSELLTTITNDAWYGGVGAYHNFEQASLRAIEEGRYLVRAAIPASAACRSYGRVVDARRSSSGGAGGRARFLRSPRFYASHGDILAYAAV